MSERFPKSRRLLKRREFLAVQRAGGGVRSRHFVTLLRSRGDEDPCRLGIVASKRVGNAVARNRGKRRVREWFRRCRGLPNGFDLVVILRVGSPDLPLGFLGEELDDAMQRAVRKARKSLKRAAAKAASEPPDQDQAHGKRRERS